MALVTGTMKDILGQVMADRQGVLHFRLNDPNIQATSTTPGMVHPTSTAIVTPISNGSFTVDLIATTNLLTDAWYILEIHWLDGSSMTDFPQWQIRVSPAGGNLADLITLGPTHSGGGGGGGPAGNLSLVLISLTKPPNLKRGQLWWKSDPDDPTNANKKNTGEIYVGV